MRCLMCGKQMGESSFRDILFRSDPLCEECRGMWQRKNTDMRFQKIPLHADYIYNDAFSSCLIQYKECGDEALKDVFLHAVLRSFKRRYRGYTLCLMPSSEEKMKQRGFSHLFQMFSCTGMDMLEPFEKITDITQKGMSYQQRLRMREDICLKENIQLPKKIVLCDDVMTTGSTLKGALNCMGDTTRDVRIYVCAVTNMKNDKVKMKRDENSS